MDKPKPKLLVFDLDYTLWPFWIDTHITPPMEKRGQRVYDKSNRLVDPYEGVHDLLQELRIQGYELALASRTETPKLANQLLDYYKWDCFTYKEIYPGEKTTHFQRIQLMSNHPYSEMIFFDDEERNVSEVSKLGVHSVLVEGGVNLKLVEEAVTKWGAKK